MPTPGDVLPFRSDVYSDGVLVNASTAVLTVTLPDGSTATPAVTNPSTGKYAADYQTTAASPVGRYLGHWAFTFAGGAGSVYDETIDLVASIITVDEALAHLRAAGVITSEPDLEQLEWLCAVATDAVERDLGRNYTRKTVTELHSGGGYGLVLHRSPVLSVTSVSESGVSLSASDYQLDPETPILYRGSSSYGRCFSGGRLNISVTYVVGSLNPPPIVRKVALNTVQGMWQESQQTPLPSLQSFDEGSVGVSTAALHPVERSAYESLRAVAIA